MKNTKKNKRSNPSDLTTRNARAYNKKFAQIFHHYDYLLIENEGLKLRVSKLELENEAEKIQLKKIMTYFQQYFIKRKK